MLLPSDVARLVLGYLQEEGLSSTSQAFIHESPNLKEYADHTIGDGTIPACVFSVFGKGLTTILNEYMATKTKESCHEVPAVMTSLWKKLDFTLNQIKSLQNAPSISAACQRTRSRIGVANLARQRVLTVASSSAVVCTSVSETSSIISPMQTSHSMLGHSTPVSYATPTTRPAIGSGTHQLVHDVRVNTPRDSPVQVIVSEHRLNPGPMSPGRRKWDTPRKRGGAASGSSCPGRCATTASSLGAEPQPEEAVDENFPQLVIQNARDKILGDRSLQEKLAENINKILASDPMPQTSKVSSSTVEADQSIDEILGLQGEIHMSDDAIHDILEQTENDPAFQALYDLFDYNKTKFTDAEPGVGDIGGTPEEGDAAGPTTAVRPPQSDEPGATQRDANPPDMTQTTVKTRAAQERKTRKSTAPALLKKTVLGSGGRSSRIENSSARLLVIQGEQRGASSSSVDSNRKEKASLLNSSVFETPMDIDEPLNTPSPPSDIMASLEPASQDSSSTTAALTASTTVPSSVSSAVFALPETTSASNMDKKQERKQARQQPADTLVAQSNQPALLSSEQFEQNNTPVLTADLPQMPQMSTSSSGGDAQPVFTLSDTPNSAPSTSASPATTQGSASTSAKLTATAVSSTAASPTPSASCPPVGATSSSLAANCSTPSKSAADTNIVSLKIIISDNQEEESSSDPALAQAISSISGDKIPTIYLSSPAKPTAVPGTPKANLDEVAQAVSGLQNAEVQGSPLTSKPAAFMTSPLTGTSQVQQNYIIQLPLDTTTPALQAAPASYFLVTEPPTTDAQSRPVLLSASVSKAQPLPLNQYGPTPPPSSQGYSTGSALILPSPVKPMVLPVSVVGQNTIGKVQMVSNRLVAIPNTVPVQQSETVNSKSPSVAIKWSKPAGTDQHVVNQTVQPVSGNAQQDSTKGSKHRRILCFDSSAEGQQQTAKTSATTSTNASTSQSAKQTEKNKSQPTTFTKPNILGGNKPKRRVQTVKCTAEPLADGAFMKESEKPTTPPQHQKDAVKKNPRKQDHSIHSQDSQSATTSKVDASQPENLKKSESGSRSKSIDRKNNRESCDKDGDGTKSKDSHSSRSTDSSLKSGARKEKEESSRKEQAEKASAKTREGRTEKRTPSQEVPNVTANKENEIKGSMQEQQQQSTPSSSASRDFSPPPVTQPTCAPQAKPAKAASKTSSLAKQAAEMLHDIQGLSSPSSSSKRPGSSDQSLPRTPATGREQESADCPRTPSQPKRGKEGEATPKHLKPPNTPDVPTCSPASEAGSENSINMAAHTLMILSRAAIARTGSPLKDSLRQDEAGETSSANSKNSKKRKLSSPKTSPPAKKDRERKKLIDCFPHDLDVDKFLSSLHYDE